MRFCPKCKYEYNDDVKICSDCNCELVDTLFEEEKFNNPVYYDENLEYLEELKKILIDNGIKNVSINEEDANKYSICTDTSSKYKAVTLLNMLFKEELQNEFEDDSFDGDISDLKENSDDSIIKKYKPLRERYKDYKDTGIVNTSIGILGDILIICFKVSFEYFCALGVVCNLFLASGIRYIIKSHNIKPEIEKEEQLTDEIKNYIRNSIDDLLKDLKIDDENEEIIYFNRIKILKDAINEKIDKLENDYVEYVTEVIYEELFD